MAALGELNVPAAMRPVAEQVITPTDKACAELLDEEYADLARHVVGKLARKRPSPLLGGRAATCAGGIVWAPAQVNFAFDRDNKPHVTHDKLAGTFGLSKPTLGNKAKQVRDTLKTSWATRTLRRQDDGVTDRRVHGRGVPVVARDKRSFLPGARVCVSGLALP